MRRAIRAIMNVSTTASPLTVAASTDFDLSPTDGTAEVRIQAGPRGRSLGFRLGAKTQRGASSEDVRSRISPSRKFVS